MKKLSEIVLPTDLPNLYINQQPITTCKSNDFSVCNYSFANKLIFYINTIQDQSFQGCSHMMGGKKTPPPPFPKICHTVTDIPQWWNLAQEQTNNTINTLTEEIKEIHQSFKKPELEIIVVKKVNDALVKQLSSVEQQCWKNAKYSHQECVEIVGITFSVKHDQVEPTVCRILHHIGVNITGVKVEACHWLGKNSDRTTATFSSRKDYEHTMCVKK